MVASYLKHCHRYTFALLMLLICCVPVTYTKETLIEKTLEHGSKLASDLKEALPQQALANYEAAAEIGTKTVNDATSTLRRIFNLFADIPERTVTHVKTAAKRIARESSFFVHELQELGAVIKESAHDFAQNARSIGQRIGQMGTNITKTECNQLAIILTVPSFNNVAEITAITELIKTYTEQEILTSGSSDAALELVHTIVALTHKAAQHTTDVQLDVAWAIADESVSNLLPHDISHTTHITIVLNGAYNLHEWGEMTEDVLRMQHYAKKGEDVVLMLDAIENLLKKAIYHSLFKSVHIA